MTLADQVKTCIETRCPVTFSLYAGYDIENGKQVRFAGGVQQKERRRPSKRTKIYSGEFDNLQNDGVFRSRQALPRLPDLWAD